MDTITTSSPEKLPGEVRVLLEEAQPLPPGVVFFEERFTGNGLALMKRAVWGVLALLAGVVLMPLSLYEIFRFQNNPNAYDQHDIEWWVFGFGGVLVLVGWLLVASIPAIRALGRRQQEGAQTRYGIFLLPDALVWRSYFDTTFIPRASYLGLNGSKVRYMMRKPVSVPVPDATPGKPPMLPAATDSSVEHTFTLPEDWIGISTAVVAQAIHGWHRPAPAET